MLYFAIVNNSVLLNRPVQLIIGITMTSAYKTGSPMLYIGENVCSLRDNNTSECQQTGKKAETLSVPDQRHFNTFLLIMIDTCNIFFHAGHTSKLQIRKSCMDRSCFNQNSCLFFFSHNFLYICCLA